jgi:60 kDa SS-A/Ro ribonucleoprotein
MANKRVFRSIVGKLIPATDAQNHEAAPAYAFDARHALAQYAVTGCLNGTFYAGAQEQLKTVLKLCDGVDAPFIARTARYCRERGYMKDMPALLCAVLSVRDKPLLAQVFPQVIDTAKMLRNFVQIVRSGAVGRKSLGTLPKRLVREWLAKRSDEVIFRGTVGTHPSLADVVKMVHPRPNDANREALYAWMLGRECNKDVLPAVIRAYEAYKSDTTRPVPDVPFEMLTALNLGTAEWMAIAQRASWQMTRMNLNTFARHGVFTDAQNGRGMAELIARRLRDREAIKRAGVFPYQLMAAHASARAEVPHKVKEALQDAMEIATENVPAISGQAYVCPDVSGSMRSPVTGVRAGATTAVRCVDLAALVAAAIVRKNPQAEVLPFEQQLVPVRLNARDSLMTNAEKLAQIGGGGTNCSAPLADLNKRRAHGDLIVFVSDNESWVDAVAGRGTKLMREWSIFKQRNPQARLVCIDIQPYGTTQAKEQADILNIGGFSDQVFQVIAEFAAGRLGADRWTGVIESMEL